MSANMPNKTLKVSGELDVSISDDGKSLILTAKEGLVSAVTMDVRWQQIWFYHPLSGWYTEHVSQVGSQGTNT